ncbi:MAG: hypothetical protein OEO20_12815 [Gemmatimonadota bacterium]|nr:hypothetical protein [Gemmatimonadota bacterium]MDH3367842.1 hypothetical protein [Gemmatimonadota bacterium]MDH3479177.1 hypothetical protein [Gemmatimonadota bacterium]MDH3570857.1 hypothetical protein [Gemmatimonadota bacterium]MDH5548600.1 hypothetical protein [Gemmatimonadota bacterium]
MSRLERCERCGHSLDLLRKPLRRLRWSRYWWEGAKSLLTGPLWVCSQCGAMYSTEGDLVAAGAIETDAERRLDVYRKDMAYLRDSFGGLIIAAELVALWLGLGPSGADILQVVIAGSVGAVSFVPFTYFGQKARTAKRDLKRLRQARRSGEILRSGTTP